MLEYERFRNPPEGYRPMPFWFWNDRIEEDEITRQMTRMKEQQVEAFFIHARHGLQTPYLSEEWFARIEHVLREAQRLEMGVWLYDENNFPSGYAGGRVLAGKSRILRQESADAGGGGGEPLTLPEGSRLEAVFVLDEAGPACAAGRVLPEPAPLAVHGDGHPLENGFLGGAVHRRAESRSHAGVSAGDA